jgi:hypothetical protein
MIDRLCKNGILDPFTQECSTLLRKKNGRNRHMTSSMLAAELGGYCGPLLADGHKHIYLALIRRNG